MTQLFVITGNVVFAGNHTNFKVSECDRPSFLAYDIDVQAIE